MDTGSVTTWRQNGGLGTWTTDGGVITELEARGGVFDASGDVTIKTITSIYAYKGSELRLNNSAKTIDVGTVYDYTSGIGTLKLDPGVTVNKV